MKKQIESIFSKPTRANMVGDGFKVFNYIPHGDIRDMKRMSPFIMLDFNPSTYFSPTEKRRGVGVHPHKGFETVTIAYKGAVAHHDSAGNSGTIFPGDVQWMTAGSGVLHKEYHEANFAKNGGDFSMVQLWVNLPKANKLTPPKYQALEFKNANKIHLPENKGFINVIAGDFKSNIGIAQGKADTFSPIELFDIQIKAGAEFTFEVPESFNAGILVIEGNLEINGEVASEHQFILFSQNGTEISVMATGENTKILFIGGEPILEPIASYGPFVMNTLEEIQTAIQETQEGKFGYLAD